MRKKLLALLCACAMIAALLPVYTAVMETPDVSTLYKKKDTATDYDASAVIKVELQGDTWSSLDQTLSQTGTTLTFQAGGEYLLTGTWNGQLAVECDKAEDVRLILDGVTVTSPEGPALYVKSADKVILTLVNDSVNTFDDQAAQTVEEDTISSCIYSKDDLSINGNGVLTVNGNVSNGIICKNDLIVAGGNINVTAVNDAIRGKDSILVLNGTLTLIAGGDGLSSPSTDEGKGIVTISGGNINIQAGGGTADAVSGSTMKNDMGTPPDGKTDPTEKTNDTAEADTVSSGTTKPDKGGRGGFGGGFGGEMPGQQNAAKTESETSAKGIKAASTLQILGGTMNLNCLDDALHAVNISIYDGDITISTGDDGAHADDTLNIAGGKITINQSYEGLEAANILISGGEISVEASDDGLNAAGGNDASASFGGWGGMDQFAAGDYQIAISGGKLMVNASGDGLDSNGSLYISGGETYVSGPTDSANGAIDYAGECIVTGGLLIAAGSSGMMQNVSNATGQAALLVYLTQNAAAGSQIDVMDDSGNVLVSYAPQKAYSCVLVSTPQLQTGKTIQLNCGGQSAFNAQLTQAVTTSGTGGGMFGNTDMGGGRGPGGRNGFGGEMPSNGMTPPDDLQQPDTTSGATTQTP